MEMNGKDNSDKSIVTRGRWQREWGLRSNSDRQKRIVTKEKGGTNERMGRARKEYKIKKSAEKEKRIAWKKGRGKKNGKKKKINIVNYKNGGKEEKKEHKVLSNKTKIKG